jgi:hypothetical protein
MSSDGPVGGVFLPFGDARTAGSAMGAVPVERDRLWGVACGRGGALSAGRWPSDGLFGGAFLPFLDAREAWSAERARLIGEAVRRDRLSGVEVGRGGR